MNLNDPQIKIVVYGVFQRFVEDTEQFIDGKRNHPKLLKVFFKEEDANEYVEELYSEWLADHDYTEEDEPRQIWGTDFETNIEKLGVQ